MICEKKNNCSLISKIFFYAKNILDGLILNILYMAFKFVSVKFCLSRNVQNDFNINGTYLPWVCNGVHTGLTEFHSINDFEFKNCNFIVKILYFYFLEAITLQEWIVWTKKNNTEILHYVVLQKVTNTWQSCVNTTSSCLSLFTHTKHTTFMMSLMSVNNIFYNFAFVSELYFKSWVMLSGTGCCPHTLYMQCYSCIHQLLLLGYHVKAPGLTMC